MNILYLKNRLLNIAKYYQKLVGFTINITERGCNCYYRLKDNYIEINLNFLIYLMIASSEECQTRFKYKNLEEFAILCLLHEIKHSIDGTINKKEFIEEYNFFKEWLTDSNLYNKYKYWELPCEKRADEFANREIKRWI